MAAEIKRLQLKSDIRYKITQLILRKVISFPDMKFFRNGIENIEPMYFYVLTQWRGTPVKTISRVRDKDNETIF